MSLNYLQQRALEIEDQRVKSAFDLVYDFAQDEKVSDADKLRTLAQVISLFDDINDIVEAGDLDDIPEADEVDSDDDTPDLFQPHRA
jgi:hypothetical protein